MKTTIKKWRRLFSSLLVLAMVLSILPTTALATGGIDISARHYASELSRADLKTIQKKLTPKAAAVIGKSDVSELDLWVYSPDMTEAEKGGTVVPYFVNSSDGTKWYLEKIGWTTSTSSADIASATTIMSSAQIASAKGSKDRYKWKPDFSSASSATELNIYYFWSKTEPTGSGEPVDPPEKPDTYTVEYKFNLPSSTARYPIGKDGKIITGGDLGLASRSITKEGVTAGAVLSSIPDDMATQEWAGYIAYNNVLDSNFYLFKGWKIGDTTYAPDKGITITSEMADGTGKITLAAEWGELKMDQADLNGMPDLTSTLVRFGSASQQIPSESGWNTTMELDADRQVCYRARFSLNGNHANLFAKMKEQTDPDLKLSVEMDKNLRWVENGSVAFQYDSSYWKPLSITCNGDTKTLTVGEDGTFTVDASFLTDEEGVIPSFTVNLGWKANDTKSMDDILILPVTKLVAPEDDPGYEAKITVVLEGYADTVHYRNYQANGWQLANAVMSDPAWQSYFQSKNIPTEQQFAYAMWYASLSKEQVSHNIRIKDESVTTKIAQRDYTVIHVYRDGSTSKGEVAENPVPAYAGDVIRATPRLEHNGDTYTLSNTANNELTVTKNGDNILTLYYDLTVCNHNWGENDGWTELVAPTCTEPGKETRTCSKCGATETRSVAALSHTPGTEWQQDGTNHWHLCTRCNEPVDIAAHSYPNTWTVRTPATVLDEGLEFHNCTVCNHEETRTIDRLPYTPVIPTPTPTPVTPNTPTPTPTPAPSTTIVDEDVPLANVTGLDNTDHFAYIKGYEDGTVRPMKNITRAEVATIFFRLMTDDYRAANWSTTNSFTDVTADAWYNAAISTAAKAGILKGYTDGSVKPNADITRAEFATIAARFISDDVTDDGVGDFSDTATHWAAKEIRLAAKAGWVQGDGNRFRPDDPITRAEVMTIVNRMLDRVPSVDNMLPGMKTWSDNPVGTWYYAAVQEATNDHHHERAEDGVTEIWTELAEAKDWDALEAQWSANGGRTTASSETQRPSWLG